MRGILIALLVIVVLLIAAISLGYINVSGNPGKLPDVQVSGGKAPDVNVQTANVSVGTEKHVIETPKIDVKKPQ